MFAVATFFSRVAGLFRQMAVGWIFGATTELSAFVVASQIPNLIRALVADAALGAAFVPVFTGLRERGDEQRAWRLAGAFVSLVLIVLGPLCVMVMIVAPWIVELFMSGQSFATADVALAVDLTRIMMPIVVLMALSGVIVGVLNSYDHFSAPALAPIAWNFVILAGLIGVVPFVPDGTRIYVYALATVAGTVVQLVIPIPWLARSAGGRRLRPVFSFRDPKIREVLVLMLPVTIGLGLINLQQLIDVVFAAHVQADEMFPGVDPGAGPAILENAFRIYMLPQGMFSVAVATVFFPLMSRLALREDREPFGHAVSEALRQIMLLLIPSAVFLAVFAHPVTRVLLQRGEFDAAQTDAVSAALMGFSIGLVFNGVNLLFVRAFFALRLTWLPTLVSVLTLALNVVFDLLLYQRWGVMGIAAATTLVNIGATVVLATLLRRRCRGATSRSTGGAAIRITFAAALSTGAAWLACDGLARFIEPASAAGSIARVACAVVVTGVVYLALAVWLGMIDRLSIRALVRPAAPSIVDEGADVVEQHKPAEADPDQQHRSGPDADR